MWPLWIYEIALGVSGRLDGWVYFWLVALTVIASIRFEFVWK